MIGPASPGCAQPLWGMHRLMVPYETAAPQSQRSRQPISRSPISLAIVDGPLGFPSERPTALGSTTSTVTVTPILSVMCFVRVTATLDIDRVWRHG